mmetsp:Transcript_27726/g.39180  ORF Transcript_27726/g.39180 Transcript_27726/m.39180 type:complete len:95 (+) Transcript_27726:131-415(+)
MDTTALPRSLLWMFSGALAPAAIKIRLCNVEISQQCSHQQRRAHTSSHMDPSHSKKKKKKKKKAVSTFFSAQGRQWSYATRRRRASPCSGPSQQ